MASRFVLPLADVGNGICPSNGAKLDFFETGSTTVRRDTFIDSIATVSTKNANPVIAGADGVFPEIFIEGTYKVILNDNDNVQQWEVDPVVSTDVGGKITLVADYTAFRALNSSLQKAGDVVKVTNDGIGGDFIIKKTTVTDNGGTLIVFTDDSGKHGERLDATKEYYNLTWFGSGTADDYAIIVAADLAAGLDGGKSVYFPETTLNVFILQNPLFIKPTTSWFSKGTGSTLKNTNLGLTSDTQMIFVDGIDDLTFDRIHLDGQITIFGSSTPNQDQAVPSDANIDDYTRCTGWVTSDAERVTIKNCRTKNIFRASFRGDALSKDLLFENCHAIRNRGLVGDPFYSQRCRSVSYVNCTAFDYTRIGFVYEGSSGLNEATDFVTWTNCRAEFAHDAHSTQNNFGFWCENAQELNASNLFAINTIAGVILSGNDSVGKPLQEGGLLSDIRTYNLSNFIGMSLRSGITCNPDDQNNAFNLSNIHVHIPAETGFDNGTATGSVGFFAVGVKDGNAADWTINISNLSVFLDNTLYPAAAGYGAIGVLQTNDNNFKKVINVVNAVCEFKDPAKVDTDAEVGTNKGFYVTTGLAGVETHLVNCTEVGSLNDSIRIGIDSYADKHKIYIDGCRPKFIDRSGNAALYDIRNCDFVSTTTQIVATKVRITNSTCNIIGFTTNDFEASDCVITESDITSVDPHTKFVVAKFSDCSFFGDLSSSSTVFISPKDVGRVTLVLFNDCVFHNSAGATNTFEFIEFDSNDGNVIGSGNHFDDRVTNYLNLNGSLKTAPVTDIDVNMPFGLLTTLDA